MLDCNCALDAELPRHLPQTVHRETIGDLLPLTTMLVCLQFINFQGYNRLYSVSSVHKSSIESIGYMDSVMWCLHLQQCKPCRGPATVIDVHLNSELFGSFTEFSARSNRVYLRMRVEWRRGKLRSLSDTIVPP